MMWEQLTSSYNPAMYGVPERSCETSGRQGSKVLADAICLTGTIPQNRA